MKNVESYFGNLIRSKLELQLSKIPKDTEESLIKEFEKVFIEDPNITFEDFLQLIEEDLTHKDLIARKDRIGKAKEKEELERLKKKQEEQKQTYEDYLKLSDSEFERRIRKKSREKLKNITSINEGKKIEITDEVSEKIEKFKSKFNKSMGTRILFCVF